MMRGPPVPPQEPSLTANSMSLPRMHVSLHVVLLAYFVFSVLGVQKLSVTPNRGTILNISSSQVKGSVCKVCIVVRRLRHCDTSQLLKDNTPVSVEFECHRPQDVINVEIMKTIECTTKSCSSHIIRADSASDLFLDYNRKLTWNLKTLGPGTIQLDFTKTGLKQISPSESCPDGLTYTLKAFLATGSVLLGKYCRMGAVSSVQILNQSSISVEVPAGQMLQDGQFDVSAGEEIKTLAKITLTLPRVATTSELLSPNFPASFPNDKWMEWFFRLAANQEAVVQVLNLTQPQCLRKETAMAYHNKGRGAFVRSLIDPQPVQNMGDFSLTLRNCEMDRRRAGSSGLSLKLKVSSLKLTSLVLCSVDLRRMKDLSLHIEKIRLSPKCEIKMNSVVKNRITIKSDSVSELSFQDCLPGDLKMTITSVIGCHYLKDCPKLPVPLLVPLLPSCLPVPLTSASWTFNPPHHGTVELTSTSFLQQSLPGHPCNDSVFKLAEDDGTTIGHFCPRGAIQKIQVHTNLSVTLTRAEGKALSPSVKPMLTVCLKDEIPERYIFTVSPKRDKPVLLATPGWPHGMKFYATVSWIVTLPPKMEAVLMFANVSQPKCSNRHTNIRVQRFDAREEDYSRREDEEAESEIIVSESFFLNMSNCMPERGDFSSITEITLQKSKSLLLTITLSVVAFLLVIFVIVLVVVCMVLRVKKQKQDHQVSIYNFSGPSLLPGHSDFPKSCEDNESHVYASIEDTLVYTHLLRKGAEMGILESDTYQSFTGHTDSQKPLVPKAAGRDSTEPVLSQQPPQLPERPPSHCQPMVANEIYHTDDLGEDQSAELGPRLDPEGGD